MSLTHNWSGPAAVKLRRTRSAAGEAAGSFWVVLNFRWRETPWMPAWRMSLSDALLAHADALVS